MAAILHRAACFAILIPLAMAADISTGRSYVIGDEAPFGLPDSSFRPISEANATGSFSIPVSNTSNPKGPLEFDGHFWDIEISLEANIPLNGSTDKSVNAAQKEQFTQFVSMSFNSVNKAEAANVTSMAKMCGNILFGLNSNATAANQDDARKGGNCDFLSQQCQKDLQAAAQNIASDCGSITVPKSCGDWFNPSSSEDEALGILSTSFEFTEKLITDSRFFTMGLPPASNNNETEYDNAVRNIWPVLFTWSQGSGTVNVTESALRCLRPNNITSGSRDPDASNQEGNGNSGKKGNGTAGTYYMPPLGATLLLAVFTFYLMF
ncbi:hypothetical protein GGI43DRAFT_433381 [Trichoderma evansii]